MFNEKTTGVSSEQKAGGMKLSDAIRLGAMLGPQLRGGMYLPSSGGSCALGAAILAIGKMDDVRRTQQLPNQGGLRFRDITPASWRWIQADRTCPECHAGSPTSTYKLIAHLNDSHWWTREQIADWVATIEPADVLVAVPSPPTPSASGT